MFILFFLLKVCVHILTVSSPLSLSTLLILLRLVDVFSGMCVHLLVLL